MWEGPRPERRGAEAAPTFVNPLAALVYIRFLRLRREDRVDAFCADRT